MKGRPRPKGKGREGQGGRAAKAGRKAQGGQVRQVRQVRRDGQDRQDSQDRQDRQDGQERPKRVLRLKARDRREAHETKTHLNRALSKRGMLTRSVATQAILDGRVRVNGRVITDPAHRVGLERAQIEVDGPDAVVPVRRAWKTLMLHKPRGVVTTRKDPQGRKTIYDIAGDPAEGLVPVGRLDMATTGLLLMTTDTVLASWIENPANRIPRVYLVTVRGEVTARDIEQLTGGILDGGDLLKASSVVIRKASGRETHLVIELREGKNREVRRLCDAIGREVTRLKRVQVGGLTLETLAPGATRALSRDEVAHALPGAPIGTETAKV
jgi:23S rRNA pseudouridine2605 synthase